MFDLYKQYEQLQENNIMLSFKGEVTFDLVKSILDVVELKLEKSEPNHKVKKKVFNVLVECLQNLCHHIEASQADVAGEGMAKTALLYIWKDDSAYHVATGNYIPNENIEKLQKWLEKINSISREELRKLYKEVLNNQQFSAKGGGGLGFIDIARKSGEKFEFKFTSIDSLYSFFSFQINIPTE